MTSAGDPVLDANGRAITATNGTVDPRRIGVVALNNPVKQGDSLVTGTPAGAGNGTVRSGALEGSGADAARSMVDMIDSMRAFEAGQKVIQAIDDTLGKAANQVGSTQLARASSLRLNWPKTEVNDRRTSLRGCRHGSPAAAPRRRRQ